jgi:hypothetical protein
MHPNDDTTAPAVLSRMQALRGHINEHVITELI